MKTVTLYRCEICNETFDTPERALACEAKGLDKQEFNPGDIVLISRGNGWYNGDETWISNLAEIDNKVPGCPNNNGNCFSKCCCYVFFYVVTAVTRHKDHPHELVYHVKTLAMQDDSGHQMGYTCRNHHMPYHPDVPIPESVKAQSIQFIGETYHDRSI